MGNTLSQMFPPKPTFTENELSDLKGKVFIVTGATSGVGFELVKLLYQKNGTIYLAARSQQKASSAIEASKTAFPTSEGRLEYLHLELDDLTTVKKSAEAFLAQEKRLDVLWNNAGVMTPPQGSKTKQGYELQMGTNCLGHFLFTGALLPILRQTASSSPKDSVRVVWTSSIVVDLRAPKGALDISELTSPSTDQNRNYAVSKAGNWLLASEMTKRHGSNGFISVTQNPGNLKTELSRDWPQWRRFLLKTFLLHDARFGAYTELFAGLSPTVTQAENGGYIIPWGRVHNAPRDDLLAALKTKEDGGTGRAAEFWDWCDKETKPFQ